MLIYFKIKNINKKNDCRYYAIITRVPILFLCAGTVRHACLNHYDERMMSRLVPTRHAGTIDHYVSCVETLKLCERS